LIEDALVLGNDYYQRMQDRKSDRAAGRIPIGIGRNAIIKKSIIDKNARIGENVRITNKENIHEGGRKDEGMWIRDGIVIITKNAVIKNNTEI
jgi:glucose-1-phosphate adenylyltransferase